MSWQQFSGNRFLFNTRLEWGADQWSDVQRINHSVFTYIQNCIHVRQSFFLCSKFNQLAELLLTQNIIYSHFFFSTFKLVDNPIKIWMKNAPSQVSNVYGTLYPKQFNPTSNIRGIIATANTANTPTIESRLRVTTRSLQRSLISIKNERMIDIQSLILLIIKTRNYGNIAKVRFIQ